MGSPFQAMGRAMSRAGQALGKYMEGFPCRASSLGSNQVDDRVINIPKANPAPLLRFTPLALRT
jgi:hypothetical protein